MNHRYFNQLVTGKEPWKNYTYSYQKRKIRFHIICIYSLNRVQVLSLLFENYRGEPRLTASL